MLSNALSSLTTKNKAHISASRISNSRVTISHKSFACCVILFGNLKCDNIIQQIEGNPNVIDSTTTGSTPKLVLPVLNDPSNYVRIKENHQ